MKKIVLLIVLLLIIPSALAIYGGESETIFSFEDCYNNITVDVTATETIDAKEYSLRDCTETEENKWLCGCNGTYDLILDTKINAINHYNFTINYSYTGDAPEGKDIGQVEVLNNDVIIKNIAYYNTNLELNLSGNGFTTVRIFVGTFGCPNNVYVNGEEVVFICYNQTVEFNTTFSIKKVVLSYPSAQVSTPSSGGGGGSSGGSLYYVCNLEQSINNNYCKNTFCPRYLNVNNCSKTPSSNHLCCITYFEGDVVVVDVVDEIEVEEIVEVIPTEEVITPTEEPEKKSGLLPIIFFVVVALIVIAFVIYLAYKAKE